MLFCQPAKDVPEYREVASKPKKAVETKDSDNSENLLLELSRSRGVADESSPWMVSYADMMTLLLIFFVLLVSVSDLDFSQFEKVADGITKAIGKQSGKMKISLESLDKEINQFIDTSGLNAELASKTTPTGVTVSISGAYLFRSGSAVLSEKALPLLKRMSDFVADVSYDVAVEGHTDDVPIRSNNFESNWELSAARASGIVRLFISQGIDPLRLRAVGFADTKPVAPARDANGNPIDENRAKNRRVVIQFLAY